MPPEIETPESKPLEEVTLGEISKGLGGEIPASELMIRMKIAAENGNFEQLIAASAAQTEAMKAMTEMTASLIQAKTSEREATVFDGLEDEIKKFGRLDPVNNKEHREPYAKLVQQFGHTNVELANKGGLVKMVNRPIGKHTKNAEDLKGIKQAWDRAYTLTVLSGGTAFGRTGVDSEIEAYNLPIMETQLHRLAAGGDHYAEMILDSGLTRTAQDTATAGEGLEWMPVGYSSELTEKIYLQLRVANLFNRFPMSAPSVKRNYAPTRGTAFIMPEALENTDAFTQKARASLTSTGVATFTAIKLAALRFWSQEFEQDSIVPAIDRFLMHLAYAHGRGIEEAILNGSTATNDLDNASTDTNRLWANTGDPATIDARKMWNGIRKQILSQSPTGRVDAGNSSATFLQKLRSLRAPMGEAGAEVDRLAFIFNTDSHIHLLNDANVITIDKYGNNATVLSGEIANIDSTPCIISPAQRNDYNASGVFDNVTENRTLVHLVHRDFFEIGERLAPQIVQGWLDLSQQGYMMVLNRVDFKRIISADYTCAAELYNVPRA